MSTKVILLETAPKKRRSKTYIGPTIKVTLTEGMIEHLERRAQTFGWSRSELIRHLVFTDQCRLLQYQRSQEGKS